MGDLKNHANACHAALSSNFISAFLCLSVPSFFGVAHLCDVRTCFTGFPPDGWMAEVADGRRTRTDAGVADGGAAVINKRANERNFVDNEEPD